MKTNKLNINNSSQHSLNIGCVPDSNSIRIVNIYIRHAYITLKTRLVMILRILNTLVLMSLLLSQSLLTDPDMVGTHVQAQKQCPSCVTWLVVPPLNKTSWRNSVKLQTKILYKANVCTGYQTKGFTVSQSLLAFETMFLEQST